MAATQQQVQTPSVSIGASIAMLAPRARNRSMAPMRDHAAEVQAKRQLTLYHKHATAHSQLNIGAAVPCVDAFLYVLWYPKYKPGGS